MRPAHGGRRSVMTVRPASHGRRKYSSFAPTLTSCAKAVSDWNNGMEDSAAHDGGAAALVQFCLRIAPEVAMQWAEDVSDEKQRTLLTIQVAVSWLAADPKKAEAWLWKSDAIDPEQKEMILSNSRLADNVGGAVPNQISKGRIQQFHLSWEAVNRLAQHSSRRGNRQSPVS